MLSKTNIYTDDWVDMVFEDRNQQYGAFELRKKSTHNTTLAVILAIVFFGLTISAPMIVNYFSGTETEEVYIPTTDIDPVDPPPIDENKIEEPPPPPPPPVKQTIIFVEQKVIKEDFVEETPITLIEETKDTEISNKTQEGDKDAPPEIVDTKNQPTGDGENTIYEVVQQKPEFPGGDQARINFLSKNLNYPNIALENMIQGKVYVSFVVEKDGRITDVKAVGKAKGFGLDEEAVRVVKLMPRWTPGKQNGNEVRVRFSLPITFKIAQ